MKTLTKISLQMFNTPELHPQVHKSLLQFSWTNLDMHLTFINWLFREWCFFSLKSFNSEQYGRPPHGPIGILWLSLDILLPASSHVPPPFAQEICGAKVLFWQGSWKKQKKKKKKVQKYQLQVRRLRSECNLYAKTGYYYLPIWAVMKISRYCLCKTPGLGGVESISQIVTVV